MMPEPNSFICGDSLEVLRGMPDKSVDMVFTDPPYGHNNNNGDLIANWEKALGQKEIKADIRPIANDGVEANSLYQDCLKEISRLLRHGGCCCCCCGGGGGPDPQFARWSLWMDEILGFKMAVVWDKGPIGMGWHYRRSYEMVLVGMKPGGPCKWYDDSQQIENVIRPGSYGIKKIIPNKEQHPTEKPIELSAHFIRLHSQPGDLILDPFCGTGSTCIAAHKLGRKFIGIDLEKGFIAIARKRYAEAIAQAELFPPDKPLEPIQEAMTL